MKLLVTNIGQLATPKGSGAVHGASMGQLEVIDHAAVLIKDDLIEWVGAENRLPAGLAKDTPRYDAQGGCVVPGFVDSHTHLVFGGYREEEFQWRLAGDSYMSIMRRGGGIASTMRATRNASREELLRAGRAHIQALLSMGVTTAEIKSGYGMDLETELRQLEVTRELTQEGPLDIFSTFMGAHDTPSEYKGDTSGYIDYIIREVLPIVAERRLAEACDIFTEKGVFEHEDTRRLLEAAHKLGFKLKMHADEIVPFAGAELAAELGCISADHLLCISDEGILRMAASDTVATLLPCTAFSLKAPYAPARKMIDAGCAVALASDLNPGSCFSSSVPLMLALATIYMGMTVEEAITALTLNGAAALRRADTIGSIEPGKQGDLVVLRFPSYKFLSYHFAMNLCHATIKRGVVYENQLVKI